MSELVEWLRTQIETRKAKAEAACGLRWDDNHETRHRGPGEWRATEHYGDMWVQEADGSDEIATDRITSPEEYIPLDPAHAAHIAANDPRDTIARCEAELAILDAHEPYYNEFEGGPACWTCGPGGFPFPCVTLRLLASSYRRREGYRKEWRP